MIKTAVILFSGLALAIGGYCALYFAKTASARDAQASERPELEWLKDEFSLSDDEFNRIRELHEAYLPDCAAMCAKIREANTELEKLVLETNQVTPEITAKLSEIGSLRQQCQSNMLRHFYLVSQSMPPAQGRRYLAEMQKLTSLSNMRDHSVAPHPEHGH